MASYYQCLLVFPLSWQNTFRTTFCYGKKPTLTTAVLASRQHCSNCVNYSTAKIIETCNPDYSNAGPQTAL